MRHYRVLLANGDPREDTPAGQDIAALHINAGKVLGCARLWHDPTIQCMSAVSHVCGLKGSLDNSMRRL